MVASPLDKYIQDTTAHEVSPYPEGRVLSGFKHLERFYKICRRPIFAKLQSSRTFDSFWILIYAGNFYITVRRSIDGLIGDHICTLWYRSSFKRNFAIAVTNYEGHFTKLAPKAIEDFLRGQILAKEFYQSQSSLSEQIPL